MPGGAGIIIAAGAELIPTSTIGYLPKIAGITPPTLNNSLLLQGLDGAVAFIQVGPTATSAAAATETFRTKGGIISEGLGVDTLIIGRGASAGAAGSLRGIAIGTLATTGAGNDSVVIGWSANANAQSGCVIVGYGASTTLATGIAIGQSAWGSGVGGGSRTMSIGEGADARCNGGGNATAIGNLSVARESDTVIGHQASSNALNAFGNRNVVIGFSATANILVGETVVVGSGATANVTQAVALGKSASVAITNGIAIGWTATIAAAGVFSIAIGKSAAITHAENILIGAGATSIAANTLMLGGANTDIQMVVVGNNNTAITPAARTFRWTNASGVDNAAGSVTWIAPLSAGAAVSAAHVFQVGRPHGSDAVLQTPLTVLTLSAVVGGGVANFNGGSLTAGAASFTTIGASGDFAVATTKFVVASATGNVTSLGTITGNILTSGGLGTININSSNGNVNSRWWRFEPLVADYGDLHLQVGASQGATPSVSVMSFTRTGAATFASTVQFNGFEQYLVAAASGTYGGAQIIRWYQSNGSTIKGGLGYFSSNSQIFSIGSRQTGGTTVITTDLAVAALSFATTGAATFASTVAIQSIGAFVASDKYLVVDASGNIHKSAIGPAS